MNKIYTLRDAQRIKYAVKPRADRKRTRTGFAVVDETGDGVVGLCATYKAAEQFIADSLNSTGWTIRRASEI